MEIISLMCGLEDPNIFWHNDGCWGEGKKCSKSSPCICLKVKFKYGILENLDQTQCLKEVKTSCDKISKMCDEILAHFKSSVINS